MAKLPCLLQMQRLYQKTITITIKILSSSLFVPLAFLTPLATRVATITIETTCQPAQQRAFTTNNGCSVPASPPTSSYNTGGGAVNATGSASFTLAANAADWNTLRVYAETVANPGVSSDFKRCLGEGAPFQQLASIGKWPGTKAVVEGFLRRTESTTGAVPR
ncbi:MAG: hypothetical protein JOZ45_15105, partial [Acidobacteriaceae bacterium]|nr:hypothetical protein [Acidobacteriaceae bacterium]